jgi:hypothetical protein
MVSGAPDSEGLVHSGWTGLPWHTSWLPGVLLGSRAFSTLRWSKSETVLRDLASWRRVYLAAKPFHMRVDVDGLSCLLHHPTIYSHQTRGHGFLPSVVLSHHCSGRWLFFGGCQSPELGYLEECWLYGYLCYRILYRVNHFYQDMLILCQSHHVAETCTPGLATTSGGDGTDSALEYMLSTACGLLWPRPIVPVA